MLVKAKCKRKEDGDNIDDNLVKLNKVVYANFVQKVLLCLSSKEDEK